MDVWGGDSRTAYIIAITTTTNKTSRVDRPRGAELGKMDRQGVADICLLVCLPLKGITVGIAQPSMLTWDAVDGCFSSLRVREMIPKDYQRHEFWDQNPRQRVD